MVPNAVGSGTPVVLFRTALASCTLLATALPLLRIVMVATYWPAGFFANVAVATSCTVPGAVNVVTVTVKLPVARLPIASRAVQVTVVVATGNVDPLAGVHDTAAAPETRSFAVAV